MSAYSITSFKVRLKLEDTNEPIRTVKTSKEVAEILKPIYADLDADQEHFCLLTLNSANRITGYKILTSGGMGEAHVDMKILFRAALALGGVALIVAHNHPSGNPRPSQSDRDITEVIQNAAKLLTFKLLDHIILGENGSYYSFADDGRLNLF